MSVGDKRRRFLPSDRGIGSHRSASVDELHLASPPRFLVVGEDPDERCQAGVVEELLRESHDGFEPVVLQYPAAGLALARARAAGEQPRRAEDDRDAAAPVLVGRLHLREHVLEEKNRSVTLPRIASAEPAVEAELVVLLDDSS